MEKMIAMSAGELDPWIALGVATWVLNTSPMHRRWKVSDIERIVMPPLKINSARFYFRNERPIGFVSWAFLDSRIAGMFVSGVRKLEPADWQSGNELWFIDFIAPENDAAEMIRDLRVNLFPDHVRAFATRRRVDGSLRRITTWKAHETATVVRGARQA